LTYDRVTRTDLLLNIKITSLWNPLLSKIMIFVTNIVEPLPLLVLLFSVSSVLFCQKRYKKLWVLAFSLTSGLFSYLAIKVLIHRIRPANSLLRVSRYSFPSGHAVISIIFFSFLIYCFKDNIKNSFLKIIFVLANIFIFLLIGFSRIYLGVHWFSDVLAGFSLGLFWLSFFILILGKKGNKK